MPRIVTAAIASVLAGSLATAQPSTGSGVVRLDPALDELISADAKVELVKGGFGFTEGPVWVQEGGKDISCSLICRAM
jgi:gluconolactonase